MTETDVQALIRIEASTLGAMLWRNNNGACTDETGRAIRFGLGNDSAQINRRMKSSDLIGLKSCGRFLAVECKRSDWTFKASDDRAAAQKVFIDLVRERGGIAGFCASVEDFRELILTGKNRHG